MKAFGGGKPAEMSSADALDVAKAATPEPGKVDDSDPERAQGRPDDQRHARRYRQGPGDAARWSA